MRSCVELGLGQPSGRLSLDSDVAECCIGLKPSAPSGDALLFIVPAGKRPDKVKLGTLRIDVSDVVRNKKLSDTWKRQRQASCSLSWSGWLLRLTKSELNQIWAELFSINSSNRTVPLTTGLVLTPHPTVDTSGQCKS